jgi:hypothetical protein
MGSAQRDVPFLLDCKMRLVEPACSWLLHIAMLRGRTRSRETWRTYAEALHDWWQTLALLPVQQMHAATWRFVREFTFGVSLSLIGFGEAAFRVHARSV